MENNRVGPCFLSHSHKYFRGNNKSRTKPWPTANLGLSNKENKNSSSRTSGRSGGSFESGPIIVRSLNGIVCKKPEECNWQTKESKNSIIRGDAIYMGNPRSAAGARPALIGIPRHRLSIFNGI